MAIFVGRIRPPDERKFKIGGNMKKSRTEKITLWVFFGLFLIYSLTLVFPFFWLFNNSLKTHQEFFAHVWSLPEEWLFSNYKLALNRTVSGYNFIQIIGNTLILTVALTFVGVFFPVTSAYTCSKYRFKTRGICMLMSLIIIAVPTIGGTAAAYKLFKALNIYDSYAALILMGSGGFGFTFMMMKATYDNISWTYAEAAFIDGASDFRVMWQIMIPLSWPTIMMLIVMSCIGTWNDYFNVYMFAPSMPTIGVGIKQLSDNLGSADASYPQLFALMIISIIPSVALYAIFQKPIMESMCGGGIKE